MCLPVVTTLSDVYLGADVQAITGLLANMGKHDSHQVFLMNMYKISKSFFEE